ncbi:hypothetical protein L3V83_01385 [Thiotrichales bacterium 19X7-9]|nr:hypothetical protein [Thiotrichales bacterium 19X7-9]
MKKLMLIIISLFAIGFATEAFSQMLIVTGKQTQVNTISQTALRQLYSGRASSSHLIPIDSPSDSPAFKDFYNDIFSWSVSEITQYRSSMLFSGKGTPPRQANSTMAALDEVSHNVNLVTYATEKQVDQFGRGFLKVIYPANYVINQQQNTTDHVSIVEPVNHIQITNNHTDAQPIATNTQNHTAKVSKVNNTHKKASNTNQQYNEKELGLAAICAKGCTPEQIKKFLNHKNQVNLITS